MLHFLHVSKPPVADEQDVLFDVAKVTVAIVLGQIVEFLVSLVKVSVEWSRSKPPHFAVTSVVFPDVLMQLGEFGMFVVLRGRDRSCTLPTLTLSSLPIPAILDAGCCQKWFMRVYLGSCLVCLIDVFGRSPNKKAIKYEN